MLFLKSATNKTGSQQNTRRNNTMPTSRHSAAAAAVELESLQPSRSRHISEDSYESLSSVGGEATKKPKSNLCLSASYGFVAAMMCAPVMVSFASIIFGDPFFHESMPSLVKLVLVSSAVHQLCYVATSTLPFAVGQVQDAGLIFLSSIARKVVMEGNNESDESNTIAAVLWTLAGSTALLGAMLVVVGKMRLASLAQYLPVPVVGGYLGYIGFYCGQAGLAMMGGVELVGLGDWRRLWNKRVAIRVAPGFAVAVAIKSASEYLSRRPHIGRTTRAAVVPGVLAVAVVVFYVVLWTTGATIQEARDAGWVGQAAASSASSSSPWSLYFPSSLRSTRKLFVQSLPKVAPTWLGMVIVVAFSSSLDVAAIEMELGRPLDYDAELRTVGLGNLCSGLLGGFSGSYIFSQTILNMRSEVADRVSGVVIAALEIALALVVPVAPTALAPACAFGGMLLTIAIELLEEWLWKSRLRFSRAEYAVALITFLAIHLLGLEEGFVAGLVCAALAFAISHGPSDAVFKCRPSAVTRSVVMREFEQRAYLSDAVRVGKIVVLDLRGFVFFGAAAKLLAKLRNDLRLPVAASLDKTWYRSSFAGAATTELGPPKFAVLDCSDFSGVDATAARACFVPLRRMLRDCGSRLFFAGLQPDVKKTLTSHGFVVDFDFPSLDAALETAEEALLGHSSSSRSRRTRDGNSAVSIRHILSDFVGRDEYFVEKLQLLEEKVEDLYFERRSLNAGDVLETNDRLYFVACGLVDLNVTDDTDKKRILRITRGGVCGELSFFLRRSQRFRATCAEETIVFVLDRDGANRMRQAHPDLFLLLQAALINTLCLQVEDSLGPAAPPAIFSADNL